MALVVAPTTVSTATGVPHGPQPGASPSFPQRGNALTPSATTAPKRTAAGRYKKRPVVYTEDEDSDKGSDRTSDSERILPKRLRRGTIATRGPSEPTEDTGDSSDNLPPDISTLLQSPTPSSRHSGDPSGDTDSNASRLQSPDQSSHADWETTGCNTPLPTIPTTKETLLSNVSPTESRDVGATGIRTTGDVSPKTGSHTAATTVVPKFLTITPKKSKASIYSYLIRREDPHFQNLLKVYIAFENIAAASGQAGSLSTTGRPPQVSWWIRSARFSTLPPLSDLHDYGSSVISWWSHLQPSWRELDYPRSNRDNGAFGCLVQPGINGLLNIIILAYWWSNGLTEAGGEGDAEDQRYHWFVADVSWVLLKLVETVSMN